MYLERLAVLDRQIQTLDTLVAGELKKQEEAVIRIAQMPGFGVDSAQQLIAEVGVNAETFPSASQVGTCPGIGEERRAKPKFAIRKGIVLCVRRILTQAAQAAVKKKGCHFQSVFRRLLPRLATKGRLSYRTPLGPLGLEDPS